MDFSDQQIVDSSKPPLVFLKGDFGCCQGIIIRTAHALNYTINHPEQ